MGQRPPPPLSAFFLNSLRQVFFFSVCSILQTDGRQIKDDDIANKRVPLSIYSITGYPPPPKPSISLPPSPHPITIENHSGSPPPSPDPFASDHPSPLHSGQLLRNNLLREIENPSRTKVTVIALRC
jgi:hypothetical protein